MARASAITTVIVSVLLNMALRFQLGLWGFYAFDHIPLGGIGCQRNSLRHEAQVMSEHEHEHSHPHTHQSHEAIIKRLKRADGHLRGIITMIEEGRECVDIAQQLHAVEKAICQAKRTLIQDHIDHCLEDTVSALNNGELAPLEAFKQITRYL
jgi:DNA-binding FrmR family transcriptional regulator